MPTRKSKPARSSDPAPDSALDEAEAMPARVVTIDLGASDAGKRLDKALADRLTEHSRARLQGLVAEGHVKIDGHAEVNAARRMRGGERVTVALPAAVPAEPQGEVIALDIVHEDADVVVVNKPAGMVVHPSNGHDGGTLVNALIAHCGASLSGINGVLRPGIVHRLDKDTSGLLVVAKNDRAHRALAEQFADHGRTGPLERRYLAIVWGELPRSTGTIDAGIARSSINRERMVVSGAERARFAITHYEVLESYGVASLIACRLETGRTHQIRVHLAHIGHPLLGDALYGSGFRTKKNTLGDPARAALHRLARQALHAETLAFAHPAGGGVVRFAAAPPEDFASLHRALGQA